MIQLGKQLVLIEAAGVGWWVVPELRDEILGPDGLRLPDWLRSGRAQVVKHGPHRTVYRIELSGLVCYLKHNRLPDLRAWLRQLVRPSKARVEFERAVQVAERGIPTIVPLALGERRSPWSGGESFLITRSLEGAQALNWFLAHEWPALAARRRDRLRKRLAAELGTFVARMHDAGVLHRDLHPANILVRLEQDDRPLLYLVDLNAVRIGHAFDWRTCRDNLVELNRWFMPRSSRPDRLRFWRAYFDARLDSAGPAAPRHAFADLARELEHRAWQSNLDFWKRRDRRCWKNNRYYRKVKSKGVAGYALAELEADVLSPFLADPDAPFHRPDVRILKDSRSSTVAEMELIWNGERRRVIYKRFRVTSWNKPLVGLLRRAPAARSWLFGQGFYERCLPTARPLALLQRYHRGLGREGYLLAEKIEHALDLHQFLLSIERLAATQRCHRLRRAIDEVARVVRSMHACRLSHRDLKAANVLVSADPTRSSSPWQSICNKHFTTGLPHPVSQVWLIDLVGVERHEHLHRSRRVQNLARLNASFFERAGLTRTDKLRFLRMYLQWGLRGQAGWKRWWRQIDAVTQAKIRRTLQQGRPVG